jgi:hypothetical protein
MRVVLFAVLAVVLAGGTADAQATAGAPAAAAPVAERLWSFYASASTYILPDDPDYVQPAITADRGWLHLEGRFNYEDTARGPRGSATTSAWARR